MINIKLKDLLEEFEVSITELSEATGLARSTITPLANNPEDIKGIKIETINVICDFFNINTSQLLEFIPESTKYTIKNIVKSPNNSVFILIKRLLGNSERYTLLFVALDHKHYYENEVITVNKDAVSMEVAILDLSHKKHFPIEVSDLLKDKKILPKDIFFKDFNNQPKEIQEFTSSIIASNILIYKEMINNVLSVDVSWSDYSIFERKTYSFEVVFGKLYTYTSKDDFEAPQKNDKNIDIFLSSYLNQEE